MECYIRKQIKEMKGLDEERCESRSGIGTRQPKNYKILKPQRNQYSESLIHSKQNSNLEGKQKKRSNSAQKKKKSQSLTQILQVSPQKDRICGSWVRANNVKLR